MRWENIVWIVMWTAIGGSLIFEVITRGRVWLFIFKSIISVITLWVIYHMWKKQDKIKEVNR